MKKLHITLQENQKLWFTSDLHFGHRNVINFCDRPFSNEKEMGESLINNWNETVSENDVVFILGDVFWFNDSRSIKKCLDKLNGKTTTTTVSSSIKVGDKVVPTRLVDYNGTPLVQYDPYYTITQISGDRAVLSAPRGDQMVVWAAMNTKDIKKI